MNGRDRLLAVEALGSAWRAQDRDGRRVPLPVWHDLDASERVVAFDAALEQRVIEAALDPDGLSTTARAVLAAIGA